jgi:hypothetical protein
LEYLIANKRQQGTLGSHVRAAVERQGRRACRRQIAAAKQFTHWVRPLQLPTATQKRAQKGRETRPFRALDGLREIQATHLERMAGTTRLELATSAVTGQRSNQLNYVPAEG